MFSTRQGTTLAAGAAIAAMFLGFAGGGLSGFFGADEMMNMYNGWFPTLAELLSRDFRPVGTLVYRVLFGIWGLNPLPYRILCFILIAANLLLLYRMASRVARSREVGALACLLGAYHAHLADLYYTSSIVYDLFCFLFTFLAFVLYLDVRARGVWPGRGRTAAMLALYLCALGSKEMAVTLPGMIIAYELLCHPENRSAAGIRAWLGRGAWFLWVAVPLTAADVAWKMAGPYRMTANPAYRPTFTLHAFLEGWKPYLLDLFYGLIRFNDFRLIALWAGLLALALLLRRREMVFAWCLMLGVALPFIFLPQRGFFVMYMTLPGWYLYGASLLVALSDRLARGFAKSAPLLGVRRGQVALFVLVAVALVPLHAGRRPHGRAWVPEAYAQTRPLLRQLAARYPRMPHAARLLLVADPYPAGDYIVYFMFALTYRDKDIRLDRLKDRPVDAPRSAYYKVFDMDERYELMEVAR